MEVNIISLKILKTQIRTFTHDYYVLQLPQKSERVSFESKLPFYKDCIDFRGQKIHYAPVARIYGTNEFGQKCCCHIHGFFPSFYIKLEDYSDFMKDPLNLMNFLNMVESLYQEAYNVRKPIIYRGQLEQKMDFYGYHSKKQSFLKIYLYNPGDTLKMRELMGSKIICNKFFQCYEAHINYFMQMFTDLNILGIHEMNICNFSFRKNLPLMKMFNKIEPNILNGLMSKGWNVEKLYVSNPQHFNNLHKMSSCYVEIDFSFESILNQFEEDNDYWSDNEQSFDSERDELGHSAELVEMKVKVTTALNEIWKDELKRREKYQIKQKPYSFIDYSNNIESQIRKLKMNPNYPLQSKYHDPLWISFLKKGNNLDELKKMFDSYTKSLPKIQKSELTVAEVSNYNEQLRIQKQELIDKVKSRWDFYETRKNNIINQIIKGERDELPQWEDDNIEDDEAEENLDEEDEEEEASIINATQSVVSSTNPTHARKGPKQTTLFGMKPKTLQPKQPKSVNPFDLMMRKQTNTVKYRNNFTPKDFKVKDEGIFVKCLKCRNFYEQCWCSYQLTDFLPLQMPRENIIKNSSALVYKFEQDPPSFDLIKNEKIAPSHQRQILIQIRPYFSDFSDLLLQYNKTQLIPDLKIAQNIDRHAVYPKQTDRRPVTIKDDLKLPYFFLTFQTPLKENVLVKDYFLKYDENPPSFEEVDKEINPPKQILEKEQSRLSLAKFQDTFVSDLILLKYELLVEVSDKTKFYGNPEYDKIQAVFIELSNYQNYYRTIKCLIFVEGTFDKANINFDDFNEVFCVKSELGILQLFVNLVIRIDVDLLISYDQQKRGIYYLLMRSIQYGIDLIEVLSRSGSLEDSLEFINFKDFTILKETYLKRQYLGFGLLEQESDSGNYKKNSEATIAYLNLIKQKTLQRKNRAPELRKKYCFNIELKGRVNINLCRICEAQLKLKSYSIQNVAKSMFRTQFCQLSDVHLNEMLLSKESSSFVQSYFLDKLQLMHLIIHELNVIGGILEKSKIYGADFVSMMERGSQFKIESIMCRVTKKRGYLTLSATRNQVANQSVLQCRSLVIEPPKEFYEEPVLLFDFQSLYPSVMIAYNICYSTCLGSLKELFKDGKIKKLGVSDKLSIDLEEIASALDPQNIDSFLSQHIFVTPNKVVFVKKNIKEGLIPQILLEFLITRIMIKKSLKHYKKESIKHLLKERQTALKLFMNVLYGYTGASFTGRMPCSQIADSVVEISKYCLKQSIDYLNSHKVYKGNVIYGDTDSIFFHLPGAKLQDCFEIGKNLATELTELFPYPMEMKFQKVYQSLVLVSKKRYYGKSYESAQSSAKYEGKGLECVRRDGIEETAGLMEKMITSLIETKDLSEVKKMFVEEYQNINRGAILENDLSLAKEVKFLKYSQKSMPAHGHAAKRFQQIDPIMLPKYGERVKYVVIQSYKTKVKQRSIPLFEYMFKLEAKKSLDYEYYMNKLVLPPLHRVFVSIISLQKFLYKNIFKVQNSNLLKNSKEENKLNEAENKCYEISKLESMKAKCTELCKKCISWDGVDENNCIELNCKVLYIRKKINELFKQRQVRELQQANQREKKDFKRTTLEKQP